jgi:hypothetical protein
MTHTLPVTRSNSLADLVDELHAHGAAIEAGLLAPLAEADGRARDLVDQIVAVTVKVLVEPERRVLERIEPARDPVAGQRLDPRGRLGLYPRPDAGPARQAARAPRGRRRDPARCQRPGLGERDQIVAVTVKVLVEPERRVLERIEPARDPVAHGAAIEAGLLAPLAEADGRARDLVGSLRHEHAAARGCARRPAR